MRDFPIGLQMVREKTRGETLKGENLPFDASIVRFELFENGLVRVRVRIGIVDRIPNSLDEGSTR